MTREQRLVATITEIRRTFEQRVARIDAAITTATNRRTP